jgi:DNA-binding transcriptional regulator LsrR (DeoR family)
MGEIMPTWAPMVKRDRASPKEIMDIESPIVLAHIARLHYVRERSKQEIAQQLGISRYKVARLLDRARAEGVIRFDIREPVAIDDQASKRLEDTFGLRLALVVADDGDPPGISRAAAAWLPELLGDGEVLGVAWGTTLQQVADLIAPAAIGTEVVQICGAIAGLEPGAGPTEVAQRFADRLGGRLHGLPAPAFAAPALRGPLMLDDTVRPTLEMLDRVDVALVGIGRAERFPGSPRTAVAYVLSHLLDELGRPVDAEGGDSAIAMSWDGLNRCQLVAVAGGDGKEDALLAALRSGVLDVVITDASRAEFALAAGTESR